MAYMLESTLDPNDPIVIIKPLKIAKKHFFPGYYYDLKRREGDKYVIYFGCRAEGDVEGIKFDLSRARNYRVQEEADIFSFLINRLNNAEENF